jgi:hypothetical protein
MDGVRPRLQPARKPGSHQRMPTAPAAAPLIVDAHVHLLPERLGAAIRRFFSPEIAPARRYPHVAVSTAAAIAPIRALRLDAADEAAVLGGTAEQLIQRT